MIRWPRNNSGYPLLIITVPTAKTRLLATTYSKYLIFVSLTDQCFTNRKDETRGIFTEAVVMGMNTPSHKDVVDFEKYRTRSPKYDWKISKTVRI